MRIPCIYLLTILIVCGCQRKANINSNEFSVNKYAHGFSITEASAFTKISVFNPWENTGNSRFDYYLVPEGYNNDTIQNMISVPVKRAICLSTTHVAFFSVLGETDKICGLSGVKYISDTGLNKRIEKGEIPDVGYDQNLNYELIV
jgi:iron complex transport system substrate-binding protein